MRATLADLAQIQAGHPFRGRVPQVEGGNAYVLQMRDISPDGDIAWANLTCTRIDARRAPQWLQAGDIVFMGRGARNHALCLTEVPVPTVCSQYFFLLRVNSSKILPEFLAWQINRLPAQKYLASNAEGSDQLSIRRGVLEALPIAVPPLGKQRLIIALAASTQKEKAVLENLINKRQQQLDALACELHATKETIR